MTGISTQAPQTASKYPVTAEELADIQDDLALEESDSQQTEAPKKPTPTTQDGLASVFVRRHGNDLKFNHTDGHWYSWSGICWGKQETRLAFHWCRLICREFAKQQSEHRKVYAELKRVSTASAVERFAQSDPKVAVTHEAFDRNPWLLGTPRGTVNLRTGVMMPSCKTHMITKLAGVAPAQGECPLWLQFLDEATQGDAEMVRYIQQLTGYMLTGDTREQILIFVYGPGGNGKSVFLNVLREILNDYAKTASMDTFMSSKNDRHPTDLAMLAGARIVTASETEDGRTWAEGRIKELTGQDPVTARFMRQDFFTYVPQFKLLLIGNHAPQLRNVDDAITRRFRVIPFLNKPENPDKLLPEKLKKEYPQILNWMIQGCLDWQKNGLTTPAKVSEYTKDYLDSQDIVKQWIEECCELSNYYVTKIADLFRSWSSYAKQSNVPERQSRWLTNALIEKTGASRERGSGNAAMLRGITLTVEESNRLKNSPF
jgi:putative DNA primase/helicase